MTDAERQELSRLLETRLAEAEAAVTAGRDATGTVTLDQQSVGRLARMDAIQQQEMAKATEVRRQAEIRPIRAALDRVEDPEFGFCADCGEAIPLGRLRIDPTLPRCADCMRGA